MSEQKKAAKSTETVTEEEDVTAPQGSESAQAASEETDAIHDEIDEVLEVNAEEFDRSYIQKGGQ